MVQQSKLVLIEGVCGSGKTTLAERLHRYMEKREIRSKFYDEGSNDHPVSLTWHAYVTKAEFGKLLTEYEDQADTMINTSILEDDYVLVPYNKSDVIAKQTNLYAYLKAREICYSDSPVVPISRFTEVISKRWERFCGSQVNDDRITIFEGVFLQHQIHDLWRMYKPDSQTILWHLSKIAEKVEALCPVLIYLTQDSVRETLVRASKVRSKPHLSSETSVQFFENRKNIELEAIASLDIKSFIVNNPAYDWDKVFEEMVKVLGI